MVIRLSEVGTSLLARAGEAVNRTLVLPLLIFYPTSRCNSRCVSCDWWKRDGADDLTFDEIDRLTRSLPALGTRMVAFSGGEPLVRSDVFAIADLFRRQGVGLELLTSGVLLSRVAADVAAAFARVTISLDATSAEGYHAVRGIAALDAVESGVARLRAIAPRLPITARATLHAANYREMPLLVDAAHAMSLDGISFLAADVWTTAFGRRHPPQSDALLLDAEAIDDFQSVVEMTLATHQADVRSGFIAESPEKLRRLPEYYAAARGLRPFPPVSCNAPWVSAVVEANGSVRPCFFHEPIGNVRDTPLPQILRRDLRWFRQGLDVRSNAVCERCVCSITLRGTRNRPAAHAN
jgi:Fe-coproporphyrin III synthase